MKKILLTGGHGQVGWELKRTLSVLGDVYALDRQDLDLSNPDAICRTVREIVPHYIVNAAAYTAVDKAESDLEACMQVNAIAPRILAEEAKALNAPLIHFSTDYVFDGEASAPYSEESTTSPINIYGKSKLEGEKAIQAVGGAHLIFRTSWIYGSRGKNFLLTMLRLAKERDELKIVNDQIGAPTWCRPIAEAVAMIIARCLRNEESMSSLWGIYNLTCSGQTSWYGFAEAIFQLAPKSQLTKFPKLTPIPSSAYPLPAPRPKNSTLSQEKLLTTFGLKLPNWKLALASCLEN